VAWLGEMGESGRLGVENAAEGGAGVQCRLFDDVKPEWIEVNVNEVRVEKIKDFGGPWLGLELMRRLEIDRFFRDHMPRGKEGIGWAEIAKVLVLCRFCRPSSELHIAEHFYEKTALPDFLVFPRTESTMIVSTAPSTSFCRIKPIWKSISKTKSALYSKWITTCIFMMLRAPILKDKPKAIPRPSMVTRGTKGEIVSRSVSAWS